MCERAGEVTAQTSSKYLPLGAIFHAYSKVRGYLPYPSKQLYNPQQSPCPLSPGALSPSTKAHLVLFGGGKKSQNKNFGDHITTI